MTTFRRSILLFYCCIILLISGSMALSAAPIQLHPDNPHYFLYKGEPTILITSAEHYGAILNLDFDFKPYLDTLQQDNMNLTRVFSGAYCEPPGAFNIPKNTLAPFENRLITPWARSEEPGYKNGGNKFDLSQWDSTYFDRVKEFLAWAEQRDVIVEYVFFCPFYNDGMWELSPMKASNNINDVGHVERVEAYALKEDALTKIQTQMVEKVVRELNGYDNLFYEICNEPYFGGVTEEWQQVIAQTIVDTEKDLPKKHLIAQNIANGSKVIEHPNPNVSIFNFHYAYPPNAVHQNYDLNKVIGYDESGFSGDNDTKYRGDAWAFIIAGGGLFNNLDYSFTVDYETGIASQEAPGGGSPALRQQLHVLQTFMQGFDFIKMKPMPDAIQSIKPNKSKAWLLGEAKVGYALYLRDGTQAELDIKLPQGSYDVEWVSTITGETVERNRNIQSQEGVLTIESPRYHDDIAARIFSNQN